MSRYRVTVQTPRGPVDVDVRTLRGSEAEATACAIRALVDRRDYGDSSGMVPTSVRKVA